MNETATIYVWSLQYIGKGSFWGRGQRVLQIISLTTLEDLISQNHVLQVNSHRLIYIL